MNSLKALSSLVFFVCCFSMAQVPPKTPPAMKLTDPLPANLFVELGKIINPTVVNISTSSLPQRGFGRRDPLQELFEQFYGIPSRPSRKPLQNSLGTGFIIREDGLILTNAHVISGADVINVQLTESSEKTFLAKVIGSDQRTDIALIKIEADRKLPVAALGSSTETQVGEWVAAFGNPFGHGHTMTKGIISSKGREIEEINKIPLLQTDASINPGNSGGPLVNSRGFVIGVNSAIDARAQGIGFAIPIDEVKKILPDLEERGRIRRGFIGVAMGGDLDPRALEEIGFKEDEGGALVMSVTRGQPAAKAGIRPYDIITEFNGKKVRRVLDFMDAVADSPIGKKVPVKLFRDGRTLTLQVEVIERPEDRDLARKEPPSSSKSSTEIKSFGIRVSDLSDEEKSEWGFTPDLDRPVITYVEPRSLAARGGLKVGDVIIEVNRKSVVGSKDLAKQIRKGANTFRIIRENRMMIVTISP
jgi:serine protease Do